MRNLTGAEICAMMDKRDEELRLLAQTDPKAALAAATTTREWIAAGGERLCDCNRGCGLWCW